MAVLADLLRVGSIAHSLRVYLPAIVLQRVLGLVRVVLLTYLISKGQMGVWGLAMMLFTIGSPLITLGSSHGLARYVAAYEARGDLRRFLRRSALWVLALTAIATAVMVLAADEILAGARWLQAHMQARGASYGGGPDYNWPLVLAILGNVAAMGVYLNLMSFIYGMRAYRLAAATELLFSIVFTVLVIGWVYHDPGAMSLLLCHGLGVVSATLFGGTILFAGLGRMSLDNGDVLAEPVPAEPTPDGESMSATVAPGADATAEPDESGMPSLGKFLHFGLVSMVGTLIWQGASWVSFLLVYLRYGQEFAGPFLVILQFSQPILFLANASWSVLFSHVTRRWESGDRDGALFVLETSYKAMSLTVLTMTMLLYVTSPWWIRMLDPGYHHGLAYVSGLLTFFMTISNMTLLTVLARLHERPSVIALGALVGIAFNAVLALLWMPMWGEVGAARAAGVGMYFGGGIVMLIYVLATGTRLHDSTYVVLGMPVVLLLPPQYAGPLWALLLPMAIFSPWMFTADQKRVLSNSAKRGLEPLRRLLPGGRP